MQPISMRNGGAALATIALAGVLAAPTAASADGRKIVSIAAGDSDRLYAALEDPSNDGALVVLAAGTYKLSLRGGSHLGRLVLRPGMDLVGQNRYLLDANGVPMARDPAGEVFADPETIIDGTRLSKGLELPGGTPSVIQLGAANALRGVTVRAHPDIRACVEINLTTANGGADAVVSENILGGTATAPARRGLWAFASGAPFDGKLSTAQLERNVFRHTGGGLPFGWGIQIMHAQTDGDSWHIDLRSNRFYDNYFGVFVPNIASTDTETTVLSSGNIVEHNLNGLVILAGRDLGLGPAARNLVRFLSEGDTIVNNVDVASDGGGGGVFALAGLLDDPRFAGAEPGNHLDLQLLNTTFVSGHGLENGTVSEDGTTLIARNDLFLQAASSSGGLLPGPDSEIDVLIRGALSDGADRDFLYLVSDIPDPTGTDAVSIVGSDVALQHANSGLPAPSPY